MTTTLLNQCCTIQYLGDPQTVHSFAPSYFPSNQEYIIPVTGALGAGEEEKRGLFRGPCGLG